MEYNLEGMAPVQPNIFKRAWQSITLPHYGRTIGFLTLLVIALAVPATIAFLNQPTNLKQNASEQFNGGGEKGSINVFNARGDRALDKNGDVAVNSTSNTIQLEIKAPNGSTLGQTETIKFAANQKQSIIPQVYAATLCSSPRKCSYYKDAGCTYLNNNAADRQCQEENPALESGGEDGSITNSLCWVCSGNESAPTPTPIPAGGGSGSSAKCTSVNILPRTISSGQNSTGTVSYNGTPRKVKFWASTTAGVLFARDVTSWTPLTYAEIQPSGPSYTYNLPTSVLEPGQHILMVELLDENSVVLDDWNSNVLFCTTTFTIQGSGDGSQPTATPTEFAGGVSTPTLSYPDNGSTIPPGNIEPDGFGRTTLSWEHPNATSYHIRVKNETNPDEGHPSAPFGNNCTEPGHPNYVCINNYNQKWLTIAVRPGDRYSWWVHAVNGQNISAQSVGSFTISASGAGGNPTATPTTAPANPSTRIVKIDIQNVDETEIVHIESPAELSRILNGGKVGWNIPLPDFNQDLIAQPKTVEVTFWYLDEHYIKTSTTVKYAPFVMRFSTDEKNVPPQVGKNLFVYIYGNEPVKDVRIKIPDNSTIDLTNGGVISEIKDGKATTPTIAWKFRIPAEKIIAGNYVVTFSSISNGVTRDHVMEAVTVLPEGGARTPTATPTPPGARTPTATPTTARPTVTPGGPTVTPTAAPTATPIPTPTSSITPPPPGPASVNFKVVLAGIGVKTTKGTQSIVNDKPNQRKRDATLYLYEPGVDATGDFIGAKTINNGRGRIPLPKAIEYDDNGRFVGSNFNLGNTFIPGQYQVFISTPGYLRKRIPNIQTLNAGTNTINQIVTLRLGDANNDNELNTLDFRDYRSCLNQQTTSCLKADFNDDGYIDNDDKHNGKEGNNKPSFLDYNLFVSEFAVVSGD